jgi:hypothetical protein
MNNISSFYDEMRLNNDYEMASIVAMKCEDELVMQRCHLSRFPLVCAQVISSSFDSLVSR